MSDKLLDIQDIFVNIDSKQVLKNLSLQVGKGETHVLMGPNGAGKSTTMNMVCSIVRPTAGTVELLGKNP